MPLDSVQGAFRLDAATASVIVSAHDVRDCFQVCICASLQHGLVFEAVYS